MLTKGEVKIQINTIFDETVQDLGLDYGKAEITLRDILNLRAKVLAALDQLVK